MQSMLQQSLREKMLANLLLLSQSYSFSLLDSSEDSTEMLFLISPVFWKIVDKAFQSEPIWVNATKTFRWIHFQFILVIIFLKQGIKNQTLFWPKIINDAINTKQETALNDIVNKVWKYVWWFFLLFLLFGVFSLIIIFYIWKMAWYNLPHKLTV